MALRLLHALQRLKDVLIFAFEAIRIAPLPAVFVGLYSYLMIYLMVLAMVWNLGVLVWVVPVAMLSPLFAILFRVVRKHYREYLDILMGSTHFVWDIDKAVEVWSRISNERKRREKNR